jgi:hypothetical protein
MTEDQKNREILQAAMRATTMMEQSLSGSGLSTADVCEVITNSFFMFMAATVDEDSYHRCMQTLYDDWGQNVLFGLALAEDYTKSRDLILAAIGGPGMTDTIH